MKNFRRSRKALSPVVASIILIAVTVAVSIAVAAWMGALTVGFMNTESVTLGAPSFQTGTSGSVELVVRNTGTSSVVIKEVWMNNVQMATINSPTGGVPFTVTANNQVTLNFTAAITAGYNYQIKVVTSAGNPFLTTASAPQ